MGLEACWLLLGLAWSWVPLAGLSRITPPPCPARPMCPSGGGTRLPGGDRPGPQLSDYPQRVLFTRHQTHNLHAPGQDFSWL